MTFALQVCRISSSSPLTKNSKDAQDSAALLASKIYYFLGEYDEALSFALGAGNAFDTESRAYGVEEHFETKYSL